MTLKTTGKKFLATSALAFLPALAVAHGKLMQATPAAGSVVDTSVSTLKMVFNEPLEPAFSTVTVSGLGKLGEKAVTTEKAKVDEGNPRQLDLTLPHLSAGQYKVNWSVVTHDGHRTKGSYVFVVK